MFVERYGDDLTYSIAYDSGKYYLTISIHHCDRYEYKHGGLTQSCHIGNTDLHNDKIFLRAIEQFDKVLIRK